MENLPVEYQQSVLVTSQCISILPFDDRTYDEDSVSINFNGKWVAVSNEENAAIALALKVRKKDAVLNIRVNSQDLSQLKKKAKKEEAKAE